MFFTLFVAHLVLLSFNIFGYTYVYFKSKKEHKIAKAIAIYLLFLASNEIASSVLSFKGINNLFLSHSFIIIQTLILGYIFIKNFLNRNQIKLAKIYLTVTMSFLVIQYSIHPSLLTQFNLIEVFLMNYFLILCSFCYFYNTLGKNRQYGFLVIGILFYSVMSSSIFLFGNLATSVDIDIAKIIWQSHFFLVMTYQLLVMLQWINIKLNKTYA